LESFIAVDGAVEGWGGEVMKLGFSEDYFRVFFLALLC
jgi:hypothetical protein